MSETRKQPAEDPKLPIIRNDKNLESSHVNRPKLQARLKGRAKKQSMDENPIISDESMESSPAICGSWKERIARARGVKRPNAGVDVEELRAILDIRKDTTRIMMDSILEKCGPIAGSSLGPVQTSGDGSLCTTDRGDDRLVASPRSGDAPSIQEKGEEKGEEFSPSRLVASPRSGDALQEQQEEVDPSNATPHTSCEANTSHHADLVSPSSNSNGAVTPHVTLPVKGGSKFNVIQSMARVRQKPEPVCYTIPRESKPSVRQKYEQAYEKHVLKGETNGNPKVTIGGKSVTAEQFVNSLKEGGEETMEFVNVCIEAMITDWKNKNKTTTCLIIDQPTVVKILDNNCTQEFIDEYLRKEATLELLERIYIILNNTGHWVLCIMSLHLGDENLYIFCPTVDNSEKNNIHGAVIEKVVASLLRSLVKLQLEYTEGKMSTKKTKPTLQFNLNYDTNFGVKYADESKVEIKHPGDHTRNHGGAFIYLLRLIEEHTGVEILACAASHEQLLLQKKRLTHLLVYHSWNILNPMDQEPKMYQGAKETSHEG